MEVHITKRIQYSSAVSSLVRQLSSVPWNFVTQVSCLANDRLILHQLKAFCLLALCKHRLTASNCFHNASYLQRGVETAQRHDDTGGIQPGRGKDGRRCQQLPSLHRTGLVLGQIFHDMRVPVICSCDLTLGMASKAVWSR